MFFLMFYHLRPMGKELFMIRPMIVGSLGLLLVANYFIKTPIIYLSPETMKIEGIKFTVGAAMAFATLFLFFQICLQVINQYRWERDIKKRHWIMQYAEDNSLICSTTRRPFLVFMFIGMLLCMDAIIVGGSIMRGTLLVSECVVLIGIHFVIIAIFLAVKVRNCRVMMYIFIEHCRLDIHGASAFVDRCAWHGSPESLALVGLRHCDIASIYNAVAGRN